LTITIIEWLIGIFALDENNKVVDVQFFPRHGGKMKDTIIRIQKGEEKSQSKSQVKEENISAKMLVN
jgi:hypothetical protein